MASSSETPLSQSTTFSSFMGFVQRRLSDLGIRNGEEEDSDVASTPRFGVIGPSTEYYGQSQLSQSPSLHRAGLLFPRSNNASVPPMTPSRETPEPQLALHTPSSVRATTMELSSMTFPSSVPSPTPKPLSKHGLQLSPGINASFTMTHALQAPKITAEPQNQAFVQQSSQPSDESFIFPSVHPSQSPPAKAFQDLPPEHSKETASVSGSGPPSLASSLFLSGTPLNASGDDLSTGGGLDSSIDTLPSVPSARATKQMGLTPIAPTPSGEPESRTSDATKDHSQSTPRPSALTLSRPFGMDSASSSRANSPIRPGNHSSSRAAKRTGYNHASVIYPEEGLPSQVFQEDSGITSPILDTATPTPKARVLTLSPSPSHEVAESDPQSIFLPGSQQDDHHNGESTTSEGSHLLTGRRGRQSRSQKNKAKVEGELRRHDYGSIGTSPTGSRDIILPSSDTSSEYRLVASLPPSGSVLPHLGKLKDRLSKATRQEVELIPQRLQTAAKAIPAVLLGCLLNILDGVSYGMIIFPSTGVFEGLGPMGVSMFFVSAVIAQLVYTFGGSGFAGGNGSMMIEVVPFFHILASSIATQLEEDSRREVIATTLVAYALSSILTGLSFFLLGALRLGVIVGFFPRHILVGCIGGVGAFLIITGFTVSTRMPEDDFSFSWETFQYMVLNSHNLVLWLLPLFLAVLLRVITHKYHHQLIFPAYFLLIPLLFYIAVLFNQLDISHLRQTGWVFDVGDSANEPWYTFYSYLEWKLIHWDAIWSTLPTQFALLFFNILHPPLNVPALAVSLDADVDTNKELVAHGYSNLLSGLFGTVPNYLVYVNTLLFYRVGGDNRIAGFLLAVATAVLLILGSGPIAYIPVMVVGALIFVLGIDLVKEALWDTRHRVSRSEYITIVSIMVCMTVWDFVIGVLFGIVVSCFFFVLQNSRRNSIRTVFTGENALSAVRRPNAQRAYIREASKQTMILRLQGFLFFGTITTVEEAIRSLVDAPDWHLHPIRFLVLDLSLVAGVDMSAAEAFVRVQRLLSAKYITLVFCGFSMESSIGRSLRSVGVLGSSGVELFAGFNEAMEWTENSYLRTWFRSQKVSTPASLVVPGRQDVDVESYHLLHSFVASPRRSQLRDAGNRTIAPEFHSDHAARTNPDSEPLSTIVKALSSYGQDSIDLELFAPLPGYLERVYRSHGDVLWHQGDPSDGLYFIESGVLRASYRFANQAQLFEESMVGGTLAGELSALSDSPRNATVVVEHSAVLWKLPNDCLLKMQQERPELARVFVQLVLKAAKVDYDILLAAIACRQ